MLKWLLVIAALIALTGVLISPLSAQEQHELVNGKWVEVKAPPRGTAAGEVAAIRQMVSQGDDSAALRTADKFLKNYPDDPGREEVMMLAGQAEMDRGHYFQAYERFKKQTDAYPRGQYYEHVLLKCYDIADAFLRGKKRVVAGIFYLPARDDGLDILSSIAANARGTQLGETCMLRIADDRVAHREFPEAVQAYDQYIEIYPKADKVRDAMLQAAYAEHSSFHGPQYDVTALIEARQRYENFAAQYPRSAEKAKVSDIVTQIDSQRAHEEFLTAQFYERTGHPRSAVFYYHIVKSEYGGTVWAAQAQAAITRIGPQPVAEAPPPVLMRRPAASAPATAPASEPSTASEPASGSELATAPATEPAASEPVDLEKLIPATQQDKALP